MKRRTIFIFLVGAALVAFAQVKENPVATLGIKVVDEEGKPVADANVVATFEVSGVPGKSTTERGRSDANGEFCAKGASNTGFVSYGSEKSGYYPSLNLKELFTNASNGRWTPSPKPVTVTLRRMIHPIAMYAQNAMLELPRLDVPVEYDLIAGDWCAPYGSGKIGDLIFTGSRQFQSWNNFSAELIVRFKNKGDGLVPISVDRPPNQGSRLRLPHNSPVEGFIPELKGAIGREPGKPQHEDAKEDQNYFLRVRTVLDEKGGVISAHYGKIHGDFRLDPMGTKTLLVGLTYYVNPNDNDPNVEFDPDRNLFKELFGMQVVREP